MCEVSLERLLAVCSPGSAMIQYLPRAQLRDEMHAVLQFKAEPRLWLHACGVFRWREFRRFPSDSVWRLTIAA